MNPSTQELLETPKASSVFQFGSNNLSAKFNFNETPPMPPIDLNNKLLEQKMGKRKRHSEGEIQMNLKNRNGFLLENTNKNIELFLHVSTNSSIRSSLELEGLCRTVNLANLAKKNRLGRGPSCLSPKIFSDLTICHRGFVITVKFLYLSIVIHFIFSLFSKSWLTCRFFTFSKHYQIQINTITLVDNLFIYFLQKFRKLAYLVPYAIAIFYSFSLINRRSLFQASMDLIERDSGADLQYEPNLMNDFQRTHVFMLGRNDYIAEEVERLLKRIRIKSDWIVLEKVNLVAPGGLRRPATKINIFYDLNQPKFENPIFENAPDGRKNWYTDVNGVRFFDEIGAGLAMRSRIATVDFEKEGETWVMKQFCAEILKHGARHMPQRYWLKYESRFRPLFKRGTKRCLLFIEPVRNIVSKNHAFLRVDFVRGKPVFEDIVEDPEYSIGLKITAEQYVADPDDSPKGFEPYRGRELRPVLRRRLMRRIPARRGGLDYGFFSLKNIQSVEIFFNGMNKSLFRNLSELFQRDWKRKKRKKLCNKKEVMPSMVTTPEPCKLEMKNVLINWSTCKNIFRDITYKFLTNIGLYNALAYLLLFTTDNLDPARMISTHLLLKFIIKIIKSLLLLELLINTNKYLRVLGFIAWQLLGKTFFMIFNFVYKNFSLPIPLFHEVWTTFCTIIVAVSLFSTSVVSGSSLAGGNVAKSCMCSVKNSNMKSIRIFIEKETSGAELNRRLRKESFLDDNEFVFHDGSPLATQNLDKGVHTFVLGEHSSFGGNESDTGLVSKSKVSVYFQNVDGIGRASAAKRVGVRAASVSDDVICLNETNLKDTDRQILIGEKIGDECMINSLHNVTFDKGRRVKSRSKRSGFGTALLTRNVKTSFIYSSQNNEIIACLIEKSEVKTAVITFYRSPSSTDNQDIVNFYKDLEETFCRCKDLKPDVILLNGDDNSHSPDGSRTPAKFAGALMERLAARYSMRNLIEGQPTRKNLSPDTCVAWFDPLLVDVKAVVFDSWFRSDHRCVRTFIESKVKYAAASTRFKPKVGSKPRLNDSQVSELLSKRLNEWYNFWKVYPRSELTLDRAVSHFLKIIKQVKNETIEKFVYYVPVDVKENMEHDEVEIEVLKVKLARKKKTYLRTKDRALLKAIELIQGDIENKIKELIERRLEKDMKEQSKKFFLDPKRFWHNTGLFFNKESFNKVQPTKLNEKEKLEKLEKIDRTFVAKKGCEPDYGAYEKIEPENHFILKHTVKKTLEIIRKTKKIDIFYKNHATELAPHICWLINYIGELHHFPKACRSSKLTFLPSRAIFSLEALPKIFEVAMKDAFDVCFERELRNFDPGNMAYRKKSGVVLTTFLTFDSVERNEEGTVQTFCDAVKAFNASNRTEVLNEYQRVCGAGKLMRSWFEDRVYLFEGKERGLEFDRGVPAGTLCGVDGFTLFVNKNNAMNTRNPHIREVAKYSDDDSPSFSMSSVTDGGLQWSLDETFEWMTNMGGDYHLSGDKEPVLMVYLKKGQEATDELDRINLGGKNLKRVYKQRFLGVNVKVRDDSMAASKYIDSFGYELEWPVEKLKSMAYRIQSLKDKFHPTFLKLMVNSYFAGSVRFAASLYWLRASKECRARVTFYYCMAMSACLGLTAAETVGLSCCSSGKVSDENPTYKDLCETLKMPTIKDMAITDARALISQALNLRPYMFVASRSKRLKNPLPITTAADFCNSLTSDVLSLAHEKHEIICKIQKVKYRKNKKGKISKAERRRVDELNLKNRPIFLKDFNTAEKESNSLKQALVVFKNMNKFRYGVLDKGDRRRNFKTPSDKIILECKVLPPVSVRDLPCQDLLGVCMICGESCEDEGTECRICKRPVHDDCGEVLTRLEASGGSRVNTVHDCKKVCVNGSRKEMRILLNMSDMNFKTSVRKFFVQNKRIGKARRMNPLTRCDHCQNDIPISVSAHILNCGALPGTPLARAKFGSASLAKRLVKIDNFSKS